MGVDGPAIEAVRGGVTSRRRGVGALTGTDSCWEVIDRDRVGRVDLCGVEPASDDSAFRFLGVGVGVGVADDKGDEVIGGVLSRLRVSLPGVWRLSSSS